MTRRRTVTAAWLLLISLSVAVFVVVPTAGLGSLLVVGTVGAVAQVTP